MTLSFVHEARFHFDPVARQFDLRCVESNESRIQYENDQVLLIVNFDNRRSFELGVEIAKKDVHFPGPPFSLAEVLRLRGVHDSASESAVMVSDQAPRSDALAHLAELTRRHAADFLAGSDFAFAQVARLRNKEGAELELTNRLRNSRSHAEMAWKAKDYAAVVKALEPIEEHLSLVDKKRLDYSRKQNPW